VLTSARKTMPALDYVSIIRSVYGDRRAMLAGVVASALTAALTAYRSHSLPLYGVAVAFIVIGIIRYFSMRAFWRAAIDSDDAEAAEHWENHAVLSGGALALIYGLWSLAAMTLVQDPYAELASVSLSIAVMVGICARNFGLDRLVALQMVLVIMPMSIGFFLRADVYYLILAALLIVMLSSFRKLAADIRAILLSAVHGRVEASRLAGELELAMSTLEHGLCMLDEAGRVTVANERVLRTFARYDIHAVVGQPFAILAQQLSDTGKLPSPAVDRLLDIVGQRRSGKVLIALAGEHYYEVTVSSRHERSVLLFEDISERVASEEKINFMARHDALTGLPNRTYFSELALDDLAARRSLPKPTPTVALMLIDIDEFKHVNDSHGHILGDELLVQVSQRLATTMPVNAVLARLGGDEFVVYRGVGDLAFAETECDRILAAFSAPFALKGVTLPVTVSIGLVTSTASSDTLDDLMTKADLALYTAKGDGKAKSQLFHAQMDIDYHYRQRLKADLRAAVLSGELSLVFQPLVDITTRKVVTCEALARWHHPELGNIAPAVFIPIAEEMGLISDITAWVIEKAASECGNWPGNVSVAVNISARDFRGLDIVGVVNTALAQSGLDPARLEIEVTETAVIEERELANAVLAELAGKGITIALDDFGTGYSSLSYLSALPFTKLKIDRSFVSDIVTDPRALLLLANVARLGRDLQLTVVAEGVETEAQLDTMMGQTLVQQVQGYLFSRPLPARDVAELIGRLNAASRHPRKIQHMVNGS